MAVPAHDQRDFEFAKKYRLPIVEVVRGADGAVRAFDGRAAYEGDGTMVNSAPHDGLPSAAGSSAVIQRPGRRRRLGRRGSITACATG